MSIFFAEHTGTKQLAYLRAKHGDTLWKIAETYLGKGSRYTEIVKLSGSRATCCTRDRC